MKYGKRSFAKKTRRHHRSSKRHYGSSRKGRIGRRLRREHRIENMLQTVAEKKYCYFDMPNGAKYGDEMLCTDNTGVLTGVFNFIAANLAKGSSRTDRIGNSIFVRYLIFKGFFQNEMSSVSTSNQCETGQMCWWLFKERMPTTVSTKKRTNLVADWEDQIPDYPSLGYSVRKKKTRFMQGMGSTALNNTVAQPWGNQFRFKVKIPVFKKMEFISDNAWLIGGKYLEYVPVPFVDYQNYNRFNHGVFFDGNVKMTFTDV